MLLLIYLVAVLIPLVSFAICVFAPGWRTLIVYALVVAGLLAIFISFAVEDQFATGLGLAVYSVALFGAALGILARTIGLQIRRRSRARYLHHLPALAGVLLILAYPFFVVM